MSCIKQLGVINLVCNNESLQHGREARKFATWEGSQKVCNMGGKPESGLTKLNFFYWLGQFGQLQGGWPCSQ